MKCFENSPSPTTYSNILDFLFRLGLMSVFWAACSPAVIHAQEAENPQPVDPSRFKEVNDNINQLKKLRNDLGAGHPRVQEIVRNLKLLEEEMRLEQSFSERLAAQWKASEDELRERQKQEFEKSQLARKTIDEQTDGNLPSLETLELLERGALTELQRIEWELASESSSAGQGDTAQRYQADEFRLKALRLTKDLAELKLKAARDRQANPAGRSPESASQDKLVVQVLALELSIAEAQMQAAEVELAAKKQLAQTMPQEQRKRMNERRLAVEKQIQSLPVKKELAKQLVQIQQTSDQLAQQIQELEMQRFQHQSKSVELQTLLEVVRQSLSPQAPPPRAAPKSIN